MDPQRHPRVAALLEGPGRWHTLRYTEEVGSTNDDALAAARSGHPGGLVVAAARQRQGRGRAGRRWVDDPGGTGSLAISALLDVDPHAANGLVPLAAGLAVLAGVRACGVEAALKWPNDVLATRDGHTAKCAGILVEHHDLGRRAVLVIGMGVDVDWRASERRGDATAWTSIAEITGQPVDRWALLADILGGLDARLHELTQDPGRLLARYREDCATLGQQVRVEQPGGRTLQGRAVALAPDGALVLDVDDQREVVAVGDVHHLRALR